MNDPPLFTSKVALLYGRHHITLVDSVGERQLPLAPFGFYFILFLVTFHSASCTLQTKLLIETVAG